MFLVLKLSLPLNEQCIKNDLNNRSETNWDEVTDEQKFAMYKFRIDIKDDDINKVLPVDYN